eukprot:489882-Pyramimonas_sp.AAC.1
MLPYSSDINEFVRWIYGLGRVSSILLYVYLVRVCGMRYCARGLTFGCAARRRLRSFLGEAATTRGASRRLMCSNT